ncbi:DUF4192 family protein [Pseudarthrobacter scleromae]|uniref:DUF4192 family protein n=1 Tax=Pseudarthrobacter scleromae TaxID=158897 RepID=UPI0036298DC8
MEKLTITTPSDVLSFIGHTLGFWPQESLVCITLNENSIGATLRIHLPRQPSQELPYARTVAHYLTSDTTAKAILFAVYTSETACVGQPRPHAGTIAALTGVLAEQGITIRDGLFVGDETFSPYDGEPGHDLALPVSSTQTSAINAEFIYRGSYIEPADRITLPATSQEAAKATAVEHHIDTIASQPTEKRSTVRGLQCPRSDRRLVEGFEQRRSVRSAGRHCPFSRFPRRSPVSRRSFPASTCALS